MELVLVWVFLHVLGHQVGGFTKSDKSVIIEI